MRALLALLALACSASAAAAPLTLDEALALAARQSGDLAVARATRDAAAVDLYQSWQGVLPRLDLTASYGQTYIAAQKVFPSPSQGILTGFVVPSSETADRQLGLTLRWVVFDGLASWNRIAAARASGRAADHQLDESTLQIAFEITRRFYEVVKQERILGVRREAANRSEELVRRADALYGAGRGTRADTFAARVNLGNDRIALESQRTALDRARADLAQALGLLDDAEIQVVAPGPVAGPGLPPLDEPPPLDVLLARARKSRPLAAARQGLVEAAELQLSQARGGFWPTLALEGAYQRSSAELGGSYGIFGDPTLQNVTTARIALAWNLFAGRETLAAEQRAAIQVRRARVEAGQADQAIAAELARARSAVTTLARSAALAQDAFRAAEQGLQLARERLDAGSASQLEVRDATQKLAEAQLALTSSLVDHAVARADLNRAAGGSL
jgi:outer membrane protein